MQIGGVTDKAPKGRGQGKSKRPLRQKKSDRLVHGVREKEIVMCDFAMAPLDRMIEEMDRKWGIDVLPEIVSTETAVKFGSAMAKLNKAVEAVDVEMVVARSNVCQRGLAAMDKEAEASGRQRASTDIWEVHDENGRAYGIMRDGRSWQEIQRHRADLELVTLREVAIALQFYAEHGLGRMADEVKKNFEGADVVAIRMAKPLEDEEIPF